MSKVQSSSSPAKKSIDHDSIYGEEGMNVVPSTKDSPEDAATRAQFDYGQEFTGEEAVWELFVSRLAPTHRKRAKISAGKGFCPVGCTDNYSGWYKYQYAIVFPLGWPVLIAQVLGFAGYILYLAYWEQHKYFDRDVFAKVHDEGVLGQGKNSGGNMLRFLLTDDNIKYLMPYALSLVCFYGAYNYAILTPPALKWFFVVWGRKWCKKIEYKTAVNWLEAVDSAADNMRVWYLHVVFASLMCALFVSPRAAAVCVALFALSRIFTPFLYLLMNPIPQTLGQGIFTIAMYRVMLYSTVQMFASEVIDERIWLLLNPSLNLDFALWI